MHFVFLFVYLHILCCLNGGLQRVQERWYEKLHEWEKALSAYERQQEKNPDDSTFLLGRMRCLEALGEW